MRICPSCGSWHMLSPLPEKCGMCNVKLKSVPAREPHGDPIWTSAGEGGARVIPGAIRTRTDYSE